MVLLENLTVAHIAMKFPAFYETEKFLPCSKEPAFDPYLRQMNPVYLTSLRSILISLSHLHLDV
jgi:hypothetical protein